MNKNKRVKNYRQRDQNYSVTGAYFVTVFTEGQYPYLGEVHNERVKLSEIGEITKKFWLEIPSRFEGVLLDEWIIMPNHLHGIIFIFNDPETNAKGRVQKEAHKQVKNSLPSVINHFKGNVKRWCNKNGFEFFNWQSRFYDHLIRSEESLKKIRDYITFNPVEWDSGKDKTDTFNP